MNGARLAEDLGKRTYLAYRCHLVLQRHGVRADHSDGFHCTDGLSRAADKGEREQYTKSSEFGHFGECAEVLLYDAGAPMEVGCGIESVTDAVEELPHGSWAFRRQPVTGTRVCVLSIGRPDSTGSGEFGRQPQSTRMQQSVKSRLREALRQEGISDHHLYLTRVCHRNACLTKAYGIELLCPA